MFSSSIRLNPLLFSLASHSDFYNISDFQLSLSGKDFEILCVNSAARATLEGYKCCLTQFFIVIKLQSVFSWNTTCGWWSYKSDRDVQQKCKNVYRNCQCNFERNEYHLSIIYWIQFGTHLPK